MKKDYVKPELIDLHESTGHGLPNCTSGSGASGNCLNGNFPGSECQNGSGIQF